MSKALERIIEEQIRYHNDAGRVDDANYLAVSFNNAKEAIKAGPEWGTRSDLVAILKRMRYAAMLPEELADWITKHASKEYQKGYSKGLSEIEKTGVDGRITTFKGLLLWVLYHHQGGNSEIGQPIRQALGIGQFDDLTQNQIARAYIAAGKARL